MKLIDIIKKDMLIVLRDIKALIFIIIMPIVLITILSLALGGVFSSEGVSIGQIHIAVVDETAKDESAINKLLSQYSGEQSAFNDMSLYSVLDSKEVSGFLSYDKTDALSAKKMLENGEADVVVTLPEGSLLAVLTSAADFGGGAKVTVEGAEPGSLKANVAQSIVSAWADAVSSVSADFGVLFETLEESGGITQEALGKIDIESYIRSSTQSLSPDNVAIDTRSVAARKTLDSFLYYSIAITCMFVLYSAGQGSTFLYKEYEDKTLMRLLAAGISRRKLLLGKGFAVFCLSAVQLIALFAFSSLALGVDWGNPAGFILISLCTAASVTGLGVLLMVLVYRSGNPRIGGVFQAIIVQVLALFGGSFLPLFVLPDFFSTVSLFTPNGLAIRAYTENATGAPITDIFPFMAGCVALGAVFCIVGILFFPRERRA